MLLTLNRIKFLVLIAGVHSLGTGKTKKGMTDYPFCWYKFETDDPSFGEVIEYRAFDDRENYAGYLIHKNHYRMARYPEHVDEHAVELLKIHLETQRRNRP